MDPVSSSHAAPAGESPGALVVAAAPRTRRPATIPGIQVMRGIAAFMVVLHHSWLATVHAGSGSLGPLQQQLIGVGASGVDIFFVISGFIMIHVSRDRFGQPGAGREFLLKRAIRIAPLYWIIATGFLIMWLLGLLLRDDHFTTSDVICSYLFAPCVQPHGLAHNTHPLLDQGWTLSYEWYFYLLFAACLAYGSLRTLLLGAPLFFCAVIALVSRSPLHGPIALFLGDPLVFEFCFGLLVGFIHLRGVRIPTRAAALLLVVGAAALLTCGLPDRDLRWLIWGIPATLIIFGTLNLPAPKSAGGRALVWLGDASYSLYLFHGIVTMTFDHYLGEGAPDLGALQKCLYIALMCVLSIIGGALVHQLLERPVTDFLKSRHAQRGRVPASPGTPTVVESVHNTRIGMPSFDVVSELDSHEVTNAVDQANRELNQRFDFKDTGAVFELNGQTVAVKAQVEFQLKQMLEILKLRLAKRGIDVACLEIKDPVVNLAAAVQDVTLRQGVDSDIARQIVRLIKDSKIKVQAGVQGEKVRITGKQRDDLQAAMALLRKSKVDLPLQFNNFRD